MKWVLLLISLMHFACSPTKPTGPLIPANWEIAPIPNASDNVGTVYAVHKNAITYISKVEIATETTQAAVPTNVHSSQISYDVLFNFLQLKVDDSATAELRGKKLKNISFQVKNATDIRHAGNLEEAFKKKQSEIIANLRLLNLGKSDVYFITEVIRSSKVDMIVEHEKEHNSSAAIQFNNFIRFTPAISVSTKDSSTLQYDLGEPLTIMYKANKLSPQYVRTRGPEGPKDSLVNLQWSNAYDGILLIKKLSSQ